MKVIVLDIPSGRLIVSGCRGPEMTRHFVCFSSCSSVRERDPRVSDRLFYLYISRYLTHHIVSMVTPRLSSRSLMFNKDGFPTLS